MNENETEVIVEAPEVDDVDTDTSEDTEDTTQPLTRSLRISRNFPPRDS